MALFGLFGKSDGTGALKKHADRVANKRIQAVDRWESIQALSRTGSSEAIAGLLPRFTFYVDPSITDQDEKDAAFEGIMAAGASSVQPVTDFLQTAESIAWPLKILNSLLEQEAVVARLITVLGGLDTEYERDPQRKIDLISALAEVQDDRIIEATSRFTSDANETVRFSAVGAVLAQDHLDDVVISLTDCLLNDESLRVRNRILTGFVEQKLEVPVERREAIRLSLTNSYKLTKSGLVELVE